MHRYHLKLDFVNDDILKDVKTFAKAHGYSVSGLNRKLYKEGFNQIIKKEVS